MNMLLGISVAVLTVLLVGVAMLFLSDVNKAAPFAPVFAAAGALGLGVWGVYKQDLDLDAFFTQWILWSAFLTLFFGSVLAKFLWDEHSERNMLHELGSVNRELLEIERDLTGDKTLDILEYLEGGDLVAATCLSFEAFAVAVSQGKLKAEVKASVTAINTLLRYIRGGQALGSRIQLSHKQAIEKEIYIQILKFQQDTWNQHLASSLHFELKSGEISFLKLDHGFFRDDSKFDSLSQFREGTYRSFDLSSEPIQIRGERLIVGCDVYQLTSKTKVKVRQYFDEDHIENIELRVRSDRWALDLDVFDEYGGEDATSAETYQAAQEWSTFKAELNKFVSALEQVIGVLQLAANQKKAETDKKRTLEKLQGAKFGDWICLRPLGAGGFGQVWLAEKKTPGLDTPWQQSAIKVFSQSDFQSLKQFQSEIASLGQLHHPNIAHLIDNAKTGNTFWFATAYVGEVSMGKIVSSGAVVPHKSLQTYATQLFAALAHAHRRQIVHGDVHPGNLVLKDDRSAVVLVDFGLSAIGGFRTQEILTHVEYRAPELLGEQPQVGPQNDVYSAAITILTMARGHTPWRSKDNLSLLREIKRGAPSLAGIDESLARFLGPLLSIHPEKRPTAVDVFNHLQSNGFHPW